MKRPTSDLNVNQNPTTRFDIRIHIRSQPAKPITGHETVRAGLNRANARTSVSHSPGSCRWTNRTGHRQTGHVQGNFTGTVQETFCCIFLLRHVVVPANENLEDGSREFEVSGSGLDLQDLWQDQEDVMIDNWDLPQTERTTEHLSPVSVFTCVPSCPGRRGWSLLTVSSGSGSVLRPVLSS